MRPLDFVLHGGDDKNVTSVSQRAVCWCLTRTLPGEESVTVRLFGCKRKGKKKCHYLSEPFCVARRVTHVLITQSGWPQQMRANKRALALAGRREQRVRGRPSH